MEKDISKITINHLLGDENKQIRETAKRIKEKYDRIFHNDHMSLTVTLNELGPEYADFIKFYLNENERRI